MTRFSLVALLVVTACRVNAQALTAVPSQGFLQTEFTSAAGMKLALGLLYDQATVAVPEWGSGRSGLARRAGWLGASWLAGASAEYTVAALRGVDTRYRLCECKGFPKRAAHALRSGFVEYRAGGERTLAVARFSGLAAGTLATMPMLPARYGVGDAAERAVLAFGVDEGFNVLQEFRKEIVRTLVPWGRGAGVRSLAFRRP